MPDINVTATGPFFSRGPSVVHRAMQGAVRELVELGEQRLDQVLRQRPAGVFLSVVEAQKGKASTGNYRRNVHGTVQDLHGRIDDGGVIYGPWLEGTGSRNQTTRFKGYASFRRTGQWIQARVERVLRAHLQAALREIG